jgi:hypothetical protein
MIGLKFTSSGESRRDKEGQCVCENKDAGLAFRSCFVRVSFEGHVDVSVNRQSIQVG